MPWWVRLNRSTFPFCQRRWGLMNSCRGPKSAKKSVARERALVEFSPERMLAEHSAAYERAVTSR